MKHRYPESAKDMSAPPFLRQVGGFRAINDLDPKMISLVCSTIWEADNGDWCLVAMNRT